MKAECPVCSSILEVKKSQVLHDVACPVCYVKVFFEPTYGLLTDYQYYLMFNKNNPRDFHQSLETIPVNIPHLAI